MLSGRMIAVIPGDNGLMWSNLFMVSKISLYFWVLSSSTEDGEEHLFDLGYNVHVAVSVWGKSISSVLLGTHSN